jgi:hypothetical protein
MKKKYKHLYLLYYLVPSLGVLIFGWVYATHLNNRDTSPWYKSYGVVVARIPGKSGGRKFQYYHDGKLRKGWAGHGLPGCSIGDVFQILINPTDPSEALLQSEYPVLLDCELTDTLQCAGYVDKICEIEAKDSLSNSILFGFKYSVAGETHERYQRYVLPKGIKLVQGLPILVVYRRDNFRSGIPIINSCSAILQEHCIF